MDESTNQVFKTPPAFRNPTGKGGFGDNPQNRSDGRWSKANSFSYWMNYFKSLSFKEFKDYDKTKPLEERTVSEQLAYVRVSRSTEHLSEFQEVANRTEGRPVEYKEITGKDGKDLIPMSNEEKAALTGLLHVDKTSTPESN